MIVHMHTVSSYVSNFGLNSFGETTALNLSAMVFLTISTLVITVHSWNKTCQQAQTSISEMYLSVSYILTFFHIWMILTDK